MIKVGKERPKMFGDPKSHTREIEIGNNRFLVEEENTTVGGLSKKSGGVLSGSSISWA